MNRNELCIRRPRVTGRTFAHIALSALAVLAGQARAVVPVLESQPWPEAETVRTLLRADAAAALADCRVPGICGFGGGGNPLMEPPARAADDIRVTAIFGTARSLNVDVIVNGSLLRYRAGRANPIAGGGAMAPYRLMAIDGGCVRLHRDGREQTACLDTAGPQP
jgi:hypothetical protein